MSSPQEPGALLGAEPPRAGRVAQRQRTIRRRRTTTLIVALAAIVFAGLLQTGAGRALFGRPHAVAGGVTRQTTATTRYADGAEQTKAVTFHRLRVRTRPSGALLRVHRGGVGRRLGRTPVDRRIRAGVVTVSLHLEGHNSLRQLVDVNRNRSLDLWLDPKGLLHHKLATFKTGASPKQVSFSPDGREIWVTTLGESGVEVYDARTRRRLDEIKTGSYGTVEVIFTKDGKRAYVSQMETGLVFEIDGNTHRVLRRLPTDGTWSKVLALAPDEKKLYVANWLSNDVSEIDLSTGKVRRLLPTVATPRGLYAAPNGKHLFVAGFDSGELQRIDLSDGSSKTLLTTGGAMRHLVGDPSRGRVYADDMATDEVYVVNTSSGRVRKLADTDHTPNTMDLSPDGKVLYVSNRGENGESYYLPGPEWGSVLAIDTATGRILDAIVGGNQTTGLDVSPDGRFLAFSDFLDDRVTLYAIPRYETLAAGGGGRARSHLADIEK